MILQRITRHVRRRTPTDLFRKVLSYIGIRISMLSYPFKRARALMYFKNSKVRLGRNVLLKGLSYNIEVGNDVSIYDNCVFEINGDQSLIRIGNSCLFSYGVLVSCNTEIIIGDHVMIGEYSSIRDTSHSYDDVHRPMKSGQDVSAPVHIGNDVWIGRGCIIMPGTIIEDGVVVGSNSVVKGRLEKYGIYAGSPARIIKKRIEIDD